MGTVTTRTTMNFDVSTKGLSVYDHFAHLTVEATRATPGLALQALAQFAADVTEQVNALADQVTAEPINEQE